MNASSVSAESGQTCVDNFVLFQVMLEQVTVSCLPRLQSSSGRSTSFSPQTEHSSIPQKAAKRGARAMLIKESGVLWFLYVRTEYLAFQVSVHKHPCSGVVC